MRQENLTLESTSEGIHFIWNELLRLQYYYKESNGYKKNGSSRFSVGLSSDRKDRDELNQGEEIALISVSIGNPR